MLGVLISALFIYVAVLGYFLPYFLADRRRHPNATAIFFLTALLGWTGLGWGIALLWAMTARGEGGRKPRPGLPTTAIRADTPAP
ncbi:MAG: superinfection immunity protein [Rhodospirillaceae bacterium]|nr:MAG: superinfection immunity protein [Rhodospirillaceae bacterium]